MATSPPGRSTSAETPMDYLFSHIFLPRQLPKGSDTTPDNDGFLVKYVLESLREFRLEAGAVFDVAVLDTSISLVENTLYTMCAEGGLDEINTRIVLKEIGSTGSPVSLHVTAQNAGVMIRGAANAFVVDTFELSPSDESVNSTLGRLVRKFPASSIRVPASVFTDEEFQIVLAKTLVKLSVQKQGFNPNSGRTDQVPIDAHDTPNPQLVTEMLVSFLQACGDEVTLPGICKRTREEVLSNDGTTPWRRSSYWLLLRISLQLVMTRMAEDSGHTFKSFMIFFMTRILKATMHQAPSPSVHAMGTKIVRRLLKLRGPFNARWLAKAFNDLIEASDLINKRWRGIINMLEPPPVAMEAFSALEITNSTCLSLAEMDRFLSATLQSSNVSVVSPSNPTSPVRAMIDDSVPQSPSPKDISKIELAALERSFLASPNGHGQSCSSLSESIRNYHTAAAAAYAGNPEMISRMHLFLLELWIALDQAAIQSVPLVKEYYPGIPLDPYNSLLLASRGDMERLSRAESYLRQRRDYAKAQNTPRVFDSFGHPDSLAVRYFATSQELQDLENEIVEKASKERADRLEELSRLRTERKELIQLYDDGVCDRVTVEGGLWVHPDTCVRCSYLERANNLAIPTHHFPLPSNTYEAQAVVFELAVPPAIGEWRDSTIYLIYDVLRCSTLLAPPRERPTRLRSYPTLSRHFRSDKEWRVSLQSTHEDYPSTALVLSPIEDVLLSNNLKLNYADDHKGVFFSDAIPSNAHAESCSLPRLTEIEIYLTTLPSGQDWTMWVQLLTQLSRPEIELNKQENAVFVTHLSLRADPNPQETVSRKAHGLLFDVHFNRKMLRCLETLVASVEDDPGSYCALGVAVILAARILSTTEDLKPEYTQLLGYCRTVSHQWMRQTREKVHTTVDEGQRTRAVLDLLHASLVCASTFCVEPEILGEILSAPNQQSILAEASIVIQGHERMLDPGTDIFGVVLCDRWRCIMHDASSILESGLQEGQSDWLDLAVVQNWPAYIPAGGWCNASKPQGAAWEHHWVSTLSDQLTVHFNLRTGQLLVDELQLSRLPAEYQQHPCYRRLFGNLIMDVMPSSLPGMRFSSTMLVAGHSLHFGMAPTTQSNASSDLLVRLRNGGSLQDLVPKRVFKGILPHNFVHDFVHWYDHDSQTVELRPLSSPWDSDSEDWSLSSPWDSDPQNWRLTGSDQDWKLTKGDNYSLVAPSSEIGQKLAECLFPLHNDPSPMQMIFDSATSVVEIGFPELQLTFELKPSDPKIRSHEFPGMHVDTSQSVGTLVGFESKLVLCDDNNDQQTSTRILLIPEGKLQWDEVYHDPLAKHVKVSVIPGTVTRVQSYQIRPSIGPFEGRVRVQSKLYLAFLHGLTSHCMPDPLFDHTGTEAAVSILKSPEVLSPEYLCEGSLGNLRYLALLHPARSFDPLGRAQAVEWAPNLSVSSQDDRFYKLIHRIIKNTRENGLFFPIEANPFIGFVDSDRQLVNRHLSRHYKYRTTGPWPISTINAHDVFYTSRGIGQLTPRSVLGCQLASMIHRGQQFLLQEPRANLAGELYTLLNHGHQRVLVTVPPRSREMDFDSRWLQNPSEVLLAQWCRLHNACRTTPQWLNNYQSMMWFATIGYASQSIPHVTQTLFAIFAIDSVSAVPPPSRIPPRLSAGYRLQVQVLPALVRCLARPHDEFPGMSYLDYRRLVDSQVEDFCARLAVQWPCEEPATPSDQVYTTIDCPAAMNKINATWSVWFENFTFKRYLDALCAALKELPVTRPSLLPRAGGGAE